MKIEYMGISREIRELLNMSYEKFSTKESMFESSHRVINISETEVTEVRKEMMSLMLKELDKRKAMGRMVSGRIWKTTNE